MIGAGLNVQRLDFVLTLIVIIAAAIVTSASAVLPLPWRTPSTGSRAKSNRPLLIVGVLALGSILLAMHMQLG